jgi:nitrogen fixation protein NifB
MHLAVAPQCNIKCGYCTRKHDCANESRPGVTSQILTPAEALEKVRLIMASELMAPIIKVIGIAGPGDPLCNPETFETFRMVAAEFPQLILCLSTNGLLLPEKIAELDRLGLCSLTVTLNTLDAGIGAAIYSNIRYHGRTYNGRDGAAILLENQLAGIRLAARRGMTVKVNTVYIPGVNESQIPLIARKVKELGAQVMNVMPLIPQADFADIAPPGENLLALVRSDNEQIIGQMKHCRQCRADAVGIPGQDLLPSALAVA